MYDKFSDSSLSYYSSHCTRTLLLSTRAYAHLSLFIFAYLYVQNSLIPGSGPNSRDEDVCGFKVFKTLSQYLVKNNIIVVCYDDRGVGKSTGPFSSLLLLLLLRLLLIKVFFFFEVSFVIKKIMSKKFFAFFRG
jgi:hypothetical protein